MLSATDGVKLGIAFSLLAKNDRTDAPSIKIAGGGRANTIQITGAEIDSVSG